MQPYRTAGLRCPNCPEMPLREYQERLICDECQGMLIDDDDLAKACSDLVNKDIKLEFGAPVATTKICPTCERSLEQVEVTFAPVRAKAEVLRCDRDGLWFKGGLLAATFALLGRKVHGIIGYPQFQSVPRATGIESGSSVRAPATAGLRISEWHNRPRRRAKTLTPINAYGDQRLACPVCGTTELTFFGDRYACAQCTGTFVQNAAFEAMAMDIAKAFFQLPAPTGTVGPRGCPVCVEPMVVEQLEGVAIDRCSAHGIWFDANELTVALEHASGQFEHGWRAWLKRVFA
jgi:Zn-finger nucleic acid-binding protein